MLTLPAGAGVNTYRDEYVRGKISSWNLSAQKAIGQRMSVQVGYVANRQNGMTRNRNVNYGTLGGGAASQPFQPLGITAAMNVFSPDGKVKYDSLQLSMNRRMSDGIQFTTAYTYSKTTDWWATAIPIPEYFDLNKAETGRPHRLNMSLVYELPFGSGKKWLSDAGVLSAVAGGWQLNTFFSLSSGSFVTVTSNANVLNAPGTTTQFADKVKEDVEIFGDVGPNAQYFDVSAFRSVTQVRFGNAGQNVFTGPTAPNVDMSLFRVMRLGSDKRCRCGRGLQRLEHAALRQSFDEHLERHVQYRRVDPGAERRWRHHDDRPHRPPVRRARVASRPAVRVLGRRSLGSGLLAVGPGLAPRVQSLVVFVLSPTVPAEAARRMKIQPSGSPESL